MQLWLILIRMLIKNINCVFLEGAKGCLKWITYGQVKDQIISPPVSVK